MTPEEIKAEWDAFIDYPEGSDKLYVTTTSALIFARSIVKMAEGRLEAELARARGKADCHHRPACEECNQMVNKD
jgi:hypothetical protein